MSASQSDKPTIADLDIDKMLSQFLGHLLPPDFEWWALGTALMIVALAMLVIACLIGYQRSKQRRQDSYRQSSKRIGAGTIFIQAVLIGAGSMFLITSDIHNAINL